MAASPAAARDPGLILIYPGYGRPDAFSLTGRVIENEHPVREPDAHTGKLRNAIDTLRRIKSEEIEEATLEVVVAGSRYRARTDDDGMWHVTASGLEARLPVGRHRIAAHMIDDKGHPTPPATGWLHILPDTPAVAVVSDFDDTVAESYVTDRSEMIKAALTRNAAQLPPVEGASEAFRAAQAAGAVGFIFVSGSPQNLLPRLVAFLDIRRFPSAAVITRNIGEGPLFSSFLYKVENITAILKMFPRMRFVLVGDSGEKDPEVYRVIQERSPQQIAGIVIRRVPGSDVSEKRLSGMIAVDDFAGNPRVLADLVHPP